VQSRCKPLLAYALLSTGILNDPVRLRTPLIRHVELYACSFSTTTSQREAERGASRHLLCRSNLRRKDVTHHLPREENQE